MASGQTTAVDPGQGARARQDFEHAEQRMLERYGVCAESRFVGMPSIGGHAHVLLTGEGPPVVMVSGIGTPAAMWAPLMAALAGIRLYAVDLPAYGLTNARVPVGDDPRQHLVRFLEDVLDALELDYPAFIANSLGSLSTCWLALDRPARVGALVHVGCPALALDTSAPLPMRLLSVRPAGRLLTWLQPPSRGQVEQLSKMVGEHPLVPELVDLLLATERLPDYRDMFLSTLHALLQLRGSRPEVRLTGEQLARIPQPTLLVWGANDPFGEQAVAERMAARLPAAEVHVVEGGHAPWLTQSAQIGPVVSRFLHQHVSV